jgi:hypothetical protein
VEVEEVAGDNAQRELDQRNGHAKLDRRDARDEYQPGEECSKLNRVHGSTSTLGSSE